MKFFVLALVFATTAQALDFTELEKGSVVELKRDLTVNVVHGDAGFFCRIGQKTKYPKLKVGPTADSANVNVKYFLVVYAFRDSVTYQVSLQSEQLPCSCVLDIQNAPTYLGGVGSDFPMFARVDLKEVAKVPSIPTSCGNLPDWMNRPNFYDDDDGSDENDQPEDRNFYGEV